MTVLVEEIPIQTEAFSGPLDLLLSLIEKRKLFINDISLGAVADDFVKYLETHSEYPIAKTAHFVLVASTLVLIKSKSLLPMLDLTEEEEHSVEDLERRLRMYQIIRNSALSLTSRMRKIMYFTEGTQKEVVVFAPHPSITREALHSTINSIISAFPQKKEEVPKALVRKIVSLEEMIEGLAKRIEQKLTASFREFSGHGKREKVEVVVSFLAVLELVKRGIISVTQHNAFEDITMHSEGIHKPQYH